MAHRKKLLTASLKLWLLQIPHILAGDGDFAATKGPGYGNGSVIIARLTAAAGVGGNAASFKRISAASTSSLVGCGGECGSYFNGSSIEHILSKISEIDGRDAGTAEC